MHNIKITPPNISPETMNSMWLFFLEHAVPQIIEEKRMEKAEQENIDLSEGKGEM